MPRIHIIPCVVVCHIMECSWVISEQKQYYCQNPLCLQAKSEVAHLQEIMDGWHHHCQVG